MCNMDENKRKCRKNIERSHTTEGNRNTWNTTKPDCTMNVSQDTDAKEESTLQHTKQFTRIQDSCTPKITHTSPYILMHSSHCTDNLKPKHDSILLLLCKPRISQNTITKIGEKNV